MSTLLSIDPGVRGCGCALWQDDQLLRAEYVPGSKGDNRSDKWIDMATEVYSWSVDRLGMPWHVVIELPRVYQGAKQKGDPNDLIELAATVGAICSKFPKPNSPTIRYPYEWKGQVPKQIHHARAMERLSSEEKKAVVKCSASLMHNVMDAVALGLTELGRMR